MMKKCIVFLVIIVLLPCGIVFAASLLSDGITIGNRNDSIKNHYMGKNVLIEINGLYKSMDVEEYVLGVLPGTIPPDYAEEALKTQAILIRTNVLKEMLENNTSDAADLSYQYLTEEEQRKMFGELHYEKDRKRFERAVAQTAGKVVKQENSLIMALYHEVSIGKTASAKEIMDKELSYLQSVDSSQDVEAKHYMNIITYSWEEIREKLQPDKGMEEAAAEQVEEKTESGETEAAKETEGKQAEAGEKTESGQTEEGEKTKGEQEEAGEKTKSGETEAGEKTKGEQAKTGEKTEGEQVKAEEKTEGKQAEAVKEEAGKQEAGTAEKQEEGKVNIAVAESTENGFVKKLAVEGAELTGEEAMQQFGLSSTNFYVEEMEGGVRFVCLGKGNCLGVSLYGANVLALQGKTYEEIIQYYYKDVVIADYK